MNPDHIAKLGQSNLLYESISPAHGRQQSQHTELNQTLRRVGK